MAGLLSRAPQCAGAGAWNKGPLLSLCLPWGCLFRPQQAEWVGRRRTALLQGAGACWLVRDPLRSSLPGRASLSRSLGPVCDPSMSALTLLYHPECWAGLAIGCGRWVCTLAHIPRTLTPGCPQAVLPVPGLAQPTQTRGVIRCSLQVWVLGVVATLSFAVYPALSLFVFSNCFSRTNPCIQWVALNDVHTVPFPLGLCVKITVCCLKTSCFKLDLSLNFGRISVCF